MGVWIETFVRAKQNVEFYVTPFVGVWIETLVDWGKVRTILSHTLRGCVD